MMAQYFQFTLLLLVILVFFETLEPASSSPSGRNRRAQQDAETMQNDQPEIPQSGDEPRSHETSLHLEDLPHSIQEVEVEKEGKKEEENEVHGWSDEGKVERIKAGEAMVQEEVGMKERKNERMQEQGEETSQHAHPEHHGGHQAHEKHAGGQQLHDEQNGSLHQEEEPGRGHQEHDDSHQLKAALQSQKHIHRRGKEEAAAADPEEEKEAKPEESADLREGANKAGLGMMFMLRESNSTSPPKSSASTYAPSLVAALFAITSLAWR